MNEMLKPKWHSIYGQILHDRKLMTSWKQVEANKGCGGIGIIHQLRNFFEFVSYKDYKEFTSDFKEVYRASSEEFALLKLDELEDKWGGKYPHALTSWRNNWDVLCPFFKFPDDIRRIMYTTNVIGNLNRQYRKVTKSKCIFPTETSLQKMLFLVTDKATKKWTQRYRGWDKILNQLTILYSERITPYLS